MAGELLDVRIDDWVPGMDGVEADAAALQDLAGDGSLVGADVELVVIGDEVEAGSEVVGHLAVEHGARGRNDGKVSDRQMQAPRGAGREGPGC